MLLWELYAFIIFVYVVKCGSTLKCHVCNSQLSSGCLDPFNITDTLQECDRSTGGRFGGGGRFLDVVDIIMQAGGDGAASQPPQEGEKPRVENREMVCQKIVVVVGNESITGRGCSPWRVDGMHPCDAVRLSAPGSVRYCVMCPNDACNAAASVSLSPVVGAVAVAIVVGRGAVATMGAVGVLGWR